MTLVFSFLFWAVASVVAADPTSNHLLRGSGLQQAAEDIESLRSRNLQGKPIDGSFILVFDDDVQDPQSLMNDIVKKFGGVKTYEYDTAIRGFAVTGLPPGQERKIAKTKGVKLVEQDTIIALGPGKPNDVTAAACTAEETPWGVTRVTSSTSNYTGTNQVWVIDTGIDLDHPDLNVLSSKGFSAFTTGLDKTFDDLHGHGTHVAGTIAAKLDGCGVVGVAPGAQVIPVK
jgi:subtilisin family serine protease